MKEYEPKKYWEELLSNNFSLSGVGYQGLGKNYNKWLYRGRTCIMEWFLKRYPLDIKYLSILEVGCGTGFYVDFWDKRGAQNVTGLDLTEKSVERLSKKYRNYRFIQGDIGNAPPIDRKFDVITGFDVLFHIVDEERFENAIHNIGLLSKPGTIILISDNFVRKSRPAGFNQVHRTLGQYTKVLERNGIEILDLKPIFYLMNGPIDIQNDMVFKVYSFLWSSVMYMVGKSEALGNILGGTFYVIDRLLVRLLKNSITTELMVCRKF